MKIWGAKGSKFTIYLFSFQFPEQQPRPIPLHLISFRHIHPLAFPADAGFPNSEVMSCTGEAQKSEHFGLRSRFTPGLFVGILMFSFTGNEVESGLSHSRDLPCLTHYSLLIILWFLFSHLPLPTDNSNYHASLLAMFDTISLSNYLVSLPVTCPYFQGI